MQAKRRFILVLTIISTVITLICLTFQFLLPMFLTFLLDIDGKDAAAIGIIGGADGPTTIYVAGNQSLPLILLIFSVLTVAGIVYLIVNRKRK
jgi:Na+-transporting methylmalonyl-CoA/oxaloacetate decarboxylase beta subunit